MKIKEIWNRKYRPKTLNDIILSSQNRKFFEFLQNAEEKDFGHILLSGRPGIGKSTLAIIIAEQIIKCQYLYINAAQDNNIEMIKGKLLNFVQTKSIDGNIKIVVFDEADGLTNNSGNGSSAQEALKNIIEEFEHHCRFIFTCNRQHKIIEALQSRCQEFVLTMPFDEYFKRCIFILKSENIKVQGDNRERLKECVKRYYPDLRRLTNFLQKNSITGELIIDEIESQNKISNICFEILINTEDLQELRKIIIENEKDFNSDYEMLLRDLFELFFNFEMNFDNKRDVMIIISDALLSHEQVMDKEINFFATLLKISKNIL